MLSGGHSFESEKYRKTANTSSLGQEAKVESNSALCMPSSGDILCGPFYFFFWHTFLCRLCFKSFHRVFFTLSYYFITQVFCFAMKCNTTVVSERKLNKASISPLVELWWASADHRGTWSRITRSSSISPSSFTVNEINGERQCIVHKFNDTIVHETHLQNIRVLIFLFFDSRISIA